MLRHRWCGCAVLVVLTTVATVPVTRGQTTELDFQSLLGSVDWSVLGGLDRAQIEEVCRQIQHRLQGEYVVDLAALRGAAEMALPLMDALPETRPYAAWLRSRLDYLEAAEEWKFRIRPPLELGMPRELPPINPDPAWEREIWSRKLDRRPFPARAGQWVPALQPIFVRHGVPGEMVWLAEVESGFDPHAVSPAGSAGLYQLMPATARWLGLTLEPNDERFDPYRNADAAARYLHYLYQRFGDWRLALAAYNAGEGRVRRLLQTHNAQTFDEIAIRLPAETQMYVPKVEATLQKRAGYRLAGTQENAILAD